MPLMRRHLRAPLSGTVTKLLARRGESINPNEAVLTVVDTSRVRFMAAVPAALGPRIKVGATVRIDLGQEGGLGSRQAKLVFVSPVADPSSGLVDAIAEFDNADGSVRPGVTGRMLF